MSHSNIDWHSAIISGLKIELKDYKNVLTFQPEYLLNSGQRRIDCMITKLPHSPPIDNPLASFFRQYNLIDYKGPQESMSVLNFYKILSYAYSLPDFLHDVSVLQNLTITLITHHYPRNLMQHLQNTHMQKKEHFALAKHLPGLYDIDNKYFPIQLVHLPKLPPKQYLWLSCMTRQFTKDTPVGLLADSYRGHEDNSDYRNCMDTFIRANKLTAKGGKIMCEALFELFGTTEEEVRNRGISIGTAKGIDIGKQRISSLVNRLLTDNRSEDIPKAVTDMAFQDALLKEYNL